MRNLELTIEIRDSLADVDIGQWNALNDEGNPFLRYEFLRTLEATGCLGQHIGWYPRYFLLWKEVDKQQQLVGAMPTYLKTNSYGEFVFDWAWADAFERNNMPYYPKLVGAIPFTPATGQRILVHSSLDRHESILMLVQAAKQYCQSESYSGVHWLFMTEEENELLCSQNESAPHESAQPNVKNDKDEQLNSKPVEAKTEKLLRRIDCQYHWHNENFESFDDFLNQCTAKRRKTIRRERRYVKDAGIRVEQRSGASLSEQEWECVHSLYQSTYDRKWGNPSLTLGFFKEIGSVFGDNVLIILAYDKTMAQPDNPIACSVMFHGKSVLYGRYWGCSEQRNSLHFEACYYQGIEFCIEHGLSVFEPGAQGEHKITRGFIPTITRSAHYIAHPDFRRAIAEFLEEETLHVQQRRMGLEELLPFKEGSPDLPSSDEKDVTKQTKR